MLLQPVANPVLIIATFILFILSRRRGRKWMTCVGLPCLWALWRKSLMTTTPSFPLRWDRSTMLASCLLWIRICWSLAAQSCSTTRYCVLRCAQIKTFGAGANTIAWVRTTPTRTASAMSSRDILLLAVDKVEKTFSSDALYRSML